MLQFFKFVFATIIGLFLFLFLIIVIFAAVISASKTPEKAEGPSTNKVLKIVLDRTILEREPDNILNNLGGPFSSQEGGIGLLELRNVLEKAKKDKNIKGIYLQPAGVSSGYASLEEIRDALSDFKKSGKFIISYAESYSEKAYYLASVCDKIYLPPTGLLELNGLETQLLFFKGAFQKLDIQPEIFRVGSFKSAIEPFILDKMSDSNKVQTNSFINSIYDAYLSRVAISRNLDTGLLKNISDSMLVRDAQDALKYRLVTNLDYEDSAEDFIRTKTGSKKEEKVNYISYDSYYSKNFPYVQSDKKKSKEIAVIFASGAIYSGNGDDNNIFSESLVKEIRKARQDKNVKAIVLRINSPGGSALASDVIWREIILAKKEKPVIASMSDVAASGGYYIAMACDTIVAHPTTITGSIGVFGLLFNAENFLKNKLGITSDRVKTGKFSDLGSPTRKLSDFERQIIQKEVEDIYEDFTMKASQGRKVSHERLKYLASGRVWSGAEAKRNGLVDVEGGLQDAINIAASKAKINDYSLQYLPEQKNALLRQLFSQWTDEEEEAYFKNQLGKLYFPLKSIRALQKMEGIQARLPFDIHLN